MIGENLTTFAGRKVEDFDPDEGIDSPARTVYRIRSEYDDDVEWADKFAAFTEDPKASQADALIVGLWSPEDSGVSSEGVVEALVAAKAKLSNLKHLFVGDIVSEECECSWIQQTDVSPLLNAFPKLETLTIRGSEGLTFGSPRHAALRELTVQTGGLPPEVVHEISTADFPNLEHLELWLGEPNYGGDVAVDDLAPLLKGDRFPKLRYLGLKNSVIQDDVAGVVANAPVLGRLETLDLSLGELGDAGATALLGSPTIKTLKKLILEHHFISPDNVKALKKLGPEVVIDDPQEPHEWGGEQHRFISVSE